MACTFVVDYMVCGYHEYIAVLENTVVGEELSYVREIGTEILTILQQSQYKRNWWCNCNCWLH